MLAVVKERPGPGFALKEVPVPEPPPGWVRLRVRAAGICGSDLPIFDGTRPVPVPLIPGHEVAGEIDRPGEGVNGWTVGDRVAAGMVVACGDCRACQTGLPELCDHLIELGVHANGGFAECMVAPARNLHRIPSSVSFEEATAADPMASAFHGLQAAAIHDDDVVAVFGVGAIGLYAVQVARWQGAHRVIAVGRRDDALALAREVGADATVDLRGQDPIAVVRDLPGGGATVAVEATGSPAVLPLVLEAAAKAGRVVIMGVFQSPAQVSPELIVRKELRVFGRLCYTWDEYDHCLGLLASRRIRALISHVFPLSEMSKALDLIHQRKTIKVVVRP